MTDQQNFEAPRPVSADPAVALAEMLGQLPAQPADAPKPVVVKTSVEELAADHGLSLGDQNQLTIRRIKRGKGYSFVRANGTQIRHAGTIRRLHRMAMPPAYREVRYSPDPNSHLQAVGVDAAGRLQYRYHADWEKVREQRKAHRLARLVAALPKIRRNVAKHLAGDEPTREFALSAAIELIARTAIRPGNESYARLNGTRGATTLLKSNVTVEDDSLVLTFKAKGGKAVRKECKAEKLVRAIRILQTVPGKRMFQYRDANGVVRGVSTATVNGFLREIAGIKISLKDFRTLMASAVVVEIAVTGDPGHQPAQPPASGTRRDPRRRRQALQHAGDLPQELCARHHRHRLRGRHPRALRRDPENPARPVQARAVAGAGGDRRGGVSVSTRSYQSSLRGARDKIASQFCAGATTIHSAASE